MSKLDDVIKNINKQYKFDIVGTSAVKKKNFDRIPFASPAFTYLFQGGMPRTIIEVLGSEGVGKAQPMYSKVLTETGWKTFANIRLHDKIYCEDGKLHTVIGVFPQKEKKDIYEVKFTDGGICRCSVDHLWSYKTDKMILTKTDKIHTKTLGEIIKLFKENPTRQSKFVFPRTAAVEFTEKGLIIPPYILGLLIGDGALGSHSIQFTNSEDDLLHLMSRYGESIGCKVTKRRGTGCFHLTFSKHEAGTKPSNLKKKLKKIGLAGTTSGNKFIPEIYKRGSIEQRLQLLAGLINTDGYVLNSQIRFCSVSEKLVDDVIEIARSLGMIARKGAPDIRTGRNTCYTVNMVEVDSLFPFLSVKHKERYKKSTKINRNYIESIKYIGKEDCQCIYIDNPTHLYLTDDFIVTHNTALCYSVIGQAQKQFQKEYDEEIEELESLTKPNKEQKERLQYLKDRGVMRCVLLDAEFSSDDEWLTKLGVDVDSLIYIAPENQTAEQLFQILLDLMDSGGVGMVVLDSIPMLVSQQAMDKTMEEKTMGGIAATLTTFCAKMAPIVKKYNITFIGINQTREDLSSYNRVMSVGGRMWKHACFIRLLLKKDYYYDSSYNKLNAHPDTFYGHYSMVECLKNKTGDPTRKMTRFSITPSKGIDGKNDTINLAIAQGLIQKAGAWFSISDENGDAKIDSNGNALKWQGLANVIKYMEEHEDVFKELEEAVNTIITK